MHQVYAFSASHQQQLMLALESTLAVTPDKRSAYGRRKVIYLYLQIRLNCCDRQHGSDPPCSSQVPISAVEKFITIAIVQDIVWGAGSASQTMSCHN